MHGFWCWQVAHLPAGRAHLLHGTEGIWTQEASFLKYKCSVCHVFWSQSDFVPRQAARSTILEEQEFADDSETGINMDLDVNFNMKQPDVPVPNRGDFTAFVCGGTPKS